MEYIQMILSICGGISIVGGAGAIIYKVIRPAFHLNKRVDEIERRTEKDYHTLQSLVKSNSTQNLALLAMVNHMIDGNGIDKLRETREMLQKSLTGVAWDEVQGL